MIASALSKASGLTKAKVTSGLVVASPKKNAASLAAAATDVEPCTAFLTASEP